MVSPYHKVTLNLGVGMLDRHLTAFQASRTRIVGVLASLILGDYFDVDLCTPTGITEQRSFFIGSLDVAEN